MISELYGDNATIGATEYSLTTNSTTLGDISTDGVFQVFVEIGAIASGDEFLIQIKEKCLSGGSQKVIYLATLAGEVTDRLWVSPSLILMHGWDVTITKVAGLDRSLSWSIRQVA